MVAGNLVGKQGRARDRNFKKEKKRNRRRLGTPHELRPGLRDAPLVGPRVQVKVSQKFKRLEYLMTFRKCTTFASPFQRYTSVVGKRRFNEVTLRIFNLLTSE